MARTTRWFIEPHGGYTNDAVFQLIENEGEKFHAEVNQHRDTRKHPHNLIEVPGYRHVRAAIQSQTSQQLEFNVFVWLKTHGTIQHWTPPPRK